MLFYIIIFIFIGVPFLVGLFFFLRSLIKRKNIGCGFSGLIVGLLPLFIFFLFIFLLSRSCSHQSKSEFISEFERDIELSYPKSGKIIEKSYAAGYLDCQINGIIGMDTLDYKNLLQEVQLKDNFFSIEAAEAPSNFYLETKFSENECAYLYEKKDTGGDNISLWFHKNRNIVVFSLINY